MIPHVRDMKVKRLEAMHLEVRLASACAVLWARIFTSCGVREET